VADTTKNSKKDEEPNITFENATGPRARIARRRKKQHEKAQAPTGKTARRKKKQSAFSALANKHAFAVDYVSPGSAEEYALHGTAINPDTGTTAEYQEL
jgi:hypothetical protein